MFDTQTGECEAEIEFEAAVLDIWAHDFKLYAACTDGAVQMWDLVTGECIRDFVSPSQRKQKEWVDAITVRCVEHTLYVATEKTIRMWDISGKFLSEVPCSGEAFLATKQVVATTQGKSTLRIWDPPADFDQFVAELAVQARQGQGQNNRKISERFPTSLSNRAAVCSVALLRGVLYVGMTDGNIAVWMRPPPVKSGVLSKKGGGTSLFGRRAWNERYFQLHDGVLSYHKSLESLVRGEPALGKIPLTRETRFEDQIASKDLCFNLVSPQRESGLMVRCGNAVEYQEWLAAIEAHRSYTSQRVQVTSAPRGGGSQDPAVVRPNSPQTIGYGELDSPKSSVYDLDAGDNIEAFQTQDTVEEPPQAEGGPALAKGPERAGSLLVTVVQAEELVNKDTFSSSDPYCILTCGADNFRTATVENNNSPVWNETFKFWPANPDRDELQVDIFDCDAGDLTGHDNSLGSVTVRVRDVVAAGAVDKTYLVGKKTGTLTLSLTWQASTPEPRRDPELTGVSAPSGAYVPLFGREDSIEVLELKRESRARLMLAESLRLEMAQERERHVQALTNA